MSPPSTTDFSRGFHPSLVLTSRATCLTPSGQGPRPQDQSAPRSPTSTNLERQPSLTLPSPAEPGPSPNPHSTSSLLCSAAPSLTSSSTRQLHHQSPPPNSARPLPSCAQLAYQRPPSPLLLLLPLLRPLSAYPALSRHNKGISPATAPSQLLFDGCPGPLHAYRYHFLIARTPTPSTPDTTDSALPHTTTAYPSPTEETTFLDQYYLNATSERLVPINSVLVHIPQPTTRCDDHL